MELKFDNDNHNFGVDSQYNLVFIKAQENYANDMLVARGSILLNDVLEMLGFPKTGEGAVAGWIYPQSSHVIFNIRDTEDGIYVSLYPPVPNIWSVIAA